MCGAGGNAGSGMAFGPLPGARGGNGGSGGGILNDAKANAVVVHNTLIAQNLVNSGGSGGTNTSTFSWFGAPPPPPQIGNPGTNGIGFDVCGGFTPKGFNLIGAGDGSTGFGVEADQVGTDDSMINPLLGPLQMNGGFTPTHALLWGSPAIDQGKSFANALHQRGEYQSL